jgi:Cu2+-containing amine oxidase
LPTMWHSVSLVPYGFFDHNPALGVRQQAAPSGPVK